jgi:hypothetical protein
MIGDGYNVAIHCPNVDFDFSTEPDSAVVYCPLIHVSIWKSKGPIPSKVRAPAQ